MECGFQPTLLRLFSIRIPPLNRILPLFESSGGNINGWNSLCVQVSKLVGALCPISGECLQICQVIRPNFPNRAQTPQLGTNTYHYNLRSPPVAHATIYNRHGYPTQNWCKNFTGVNHITYYLSTPRKESSQSSKCVYHCSTVQINTCTDLYIRWKLGCTPMDSLGYTRGLTVETHGFMGIHTRIRTGHTWDDGDRSLTHNRIHTHDHTGIHTHELIGIHRMDCPRITGIQCGIMGIQ